MTMTTSPTSLPPVMNTGSIKGSLDGARVPANQFEMVKSIVISQVSKYSSITKSVRPWKEFVIVSKPPTSGDLILKKIQTNVVYYQSNYLVLMIGFLIFSVLTSPSCLFLFALLGAGWAFLIKKNEDPTYMLVIAGVPLGKQQRMIAASLVSGILILVFAGSIIMSVLGMSAVAVAAHALLNDSTAPERLQNESDPNDPINQI
jgi:hypothetical protein